jgi:hypothetical protein
MQSRVRLGIVVQTLFLVLLMCLPASAAHFSFDGNNVVMIDFSRKIFPIGLTLPPPPAAKTPTGKRAYKEFSDAGVLFMRTGISTQWDAAGIAVEKQYQDAAAKFGLYCQPWLRTLATSNSAATDAQLTTVVNTFKAHPGMGMWKGADEPQWGSVSPSLTQHCYQVIKSLDSDHLVWIVQAPRNTAADMAPYNSSVDITGIDIYPVSYPPGNHLVSTYPNKEISCVGEWTDLIVQASGGTKPIMMTLQIAFSGTTPPTKLLRFPTFEQQRFMAYYTIVHGARGLQYFGGTLTTTLNTRDAALGWNWTYWDNVLKRLFLEIGDKSVIQPVLVAPNSTLPIVGNNGVEYIVREISANEFYIIACMKQGPTNAATNVTFTGIPTGYTQAKILFEEPAVVAVQNNAFSHYFGPFDVHVYQFKK